jgi:exopolysaccharide biosynthesis polyprenyl glycosylphosphotransferase
MAAVRATDFVDERTSARRSFRVERTLLVVFDLVALAAAVVIGGRTDVALHLAVAAYVIGASWLDGTYRRPRISDRAVADTRSTIQTAATPLIAIGIAELLGLTDRDLVRFAAAVVPTMAIARIACAVLVRRLRRHRLMAHRTVILGSGTIADQLERTFTSHPSMGVDIVGFIGPPDPDRPVLGDLDDLTDVIARHDIEIVIVAYSQVRDHALSAALRTLRAQPTEVFVVPRLFESGSAAGDQRTQSCAGTPLVWLPHREWRPEQLAVKRAFDLLLATAALVLAAPLMLGIAIAVRLTSPGPIIFRQVRVGRNDRHFEMYKFRSLDHRVDPTATQSGGDSPHQTGVGRFIRRYSLDELPQLFNVLRGDMSMVGPRPEQPHFVAQFQHVAGYSDRHRVPVGITGWAQVNELRGGGSSLDDRAQFDNFYIEHWSLWLDVEIMLRTLTAALRGS